jgi:Tfp pilus assembly protein PilO
MKGLTMPGSGNWVATIGVYVIIILALVRFLVYPLHAAVADRRAALDDQRERNGIRTRMIEQLRQGPRTDVTQDAVRMRSALYPREASISKVQTDVVTMIRELSEGKGMALTGFEMPEAVMGKKITEVPVVVRLKGRAQSLLDLLKAVSTQDKVMLIRAMEVSANGPELTVSLTMRVLRLEL